MVKPEKTGVKALLELRPDLEEKYLNATLSAGTYNGFEYRIRTDDPNFDPHNQRCEKCHEVHKTPWEDHLIHSNVPERIGTNWAKAHHIQSIIESRSCLFEKKVGKKTVCQGTQKDSDSFVPQGDWVPYQIISESGKVTTVGKTHDPIKIKNAKPAEKTVLQMLQAHKGTRSKHARIRKGIGFNKLCGFKEDDSPAPSILAGFVIYTTKESDQSVHEILASIMNYTPQSLINSYYPSDITGYDYRRPLDLKGPTPKISYWSVYNERGNAEILLKRIREKFPDDEQVKIEIPYGVELE